MSPRRFSDFRASAQEPDDPDVEVREAMRRIAMSNDGKTLLARLLKIELTVMGPDAPDGALRDMNGVRRLARTIRLWAESEQGPERR